MVLVQPVDESGIIVALDLCRAKGWYIWCILYCFFLRGSGTSRGWRFDTDPRMSWCSVKLRAGACCYGRAVLCSAHRCSFASRTGSARIEVYRQQTSDAKNSKGWSVSVVHGTRPGSAVGYHACSVNPPPAPTTSPAPPMAFSPASLCRLGGSQQPTNQRLWRRLSCSSPASPSEWEACVGY